MVSRRPLNLGMNFRTSIEGLKWTLSEVSFKYSVENHLDINSVSLGSIKKKTSKFFGLNFYRYDN